MLKEAIDRILSLSRVEHFKIDGRNYADRQIVAIPTPTVSAIDVRTLQALISLYGANFETLADGVIPIDRDTKRPPVFQVVSHREVAVYSNNSNEFAKRTTYAVAKIVEEEGYKFGTWYSQEEFIIAVNAFFLEFGERDAVLRVVSKLASEDKLLIEDDGIGQTATARSGVSRVEQLDIKPRVLLKPFRTFREVPQPPSEFLLRIRRGSDGTPKIALFEADGGRWKLDAMREIAEYLTGKLPAEVTVVC